MSIDESFPISAATLAPTPDGTKVARAKALNKWKWSTP